MRGTPRRYHSRAARRRCLSPGQECQPPKQRLRPQSSVPWRRNYARAATRRENRNPAFPDAASAWKWPNAFDESSDIYAFKCILDLPSIETCLVGERPRLWLELHLCSHPPLNIAHTLRLQLRGINDLRLRVARVAAFHITDALTRDHGSRPKARATAVRSASPPGPSKATCSMCCSPLFQMASSSEGKTVSPDKFWRSRACL